MAFGIVFLVLLFGTTRSMSEEVGIKIKAEEPKAGVSSRELLTHYSGITYNDNCPDLSNNLGSGCTISDDCTKITCTDNSLGNKELTLTIKINKCEEPPTIDVTVEALGFSWKQTFKSDQRIRVPGLSITPFGKALSAGVYVKVVLHDNGENLKLKIMILTGIEVMGNFQSFTSSTIADSDLPISTYECGIVRWWNSLSNILKVLVVGGGVGVLALIIGICCCCCGCCKTKSNNGSVVIATPPPAATVTSTRTSVPMQPFVNEI